MATAAAQSLDSTGAGGSSACSISAHAFLCPGARDVGLADAFTVATADAEGDGARGASAVGSEPCR
eukprot:4568222-Prymnesium_polylepis.1